MAAYPYKVRLIAESVKKTDKIDAHTLLSLYKAGFLPGSYVPPKRIRELRESCRDRASLVEEATALKNRLRYKMFSHGSSVKAFSRTDMELLKSNVFTSVMAFGLEDVSKRIYQSGDTEIRGHIVKGNKFLKTLLVECVRIHVMHCPDSWITTAYHRITLDAGKKKATIAAAKRLLHTIYLMLIEDRRYRP